MVTYKAINLNFTSKRTLLKASVTSSNIMEGFPMIFNIFNRQITMLIT